MPGDDGRSRVGQLSTYWEAILNSADDVRYYATIEPFGGAVTRLYRVKPGFQLAELK